MVVEVEATAYGMVLVEGGVEEGETQVGGQTCRVGSADAEGNALVGAGLHAVAEGGSGNREMLLGLEDMDGVAATEEDFFAHSGEENLQAGFVVFPYGDGEAGEVAAVEGDHAGLENP